jgi:hypothetical protein
MTFKIWGTEDSVRFGNSLDRDAVTMLPTGGYVVTWRENQKIAFQLYDGNGAKSSALNNPQLVAAEGFFVFAKHCKMLVPGE